MPDYLPSQVIHLFFRGSRVLFRLPVRHLTKCFVLRVSVIGILTDRVLLLFFQLLQFRAPPFGISQRAKVARLGGEEKEKSVGFAVEMGIEMDEGRKRVLAIVAGILVSKHLDRADDLFGEPDGRPRTDRMVAAAVEWGELIMRKIDAVFSNAREQSTRR